MIQSCDEVRKIGTVNVQLVTVNFATRKHYHLKPSTRKKQLATPKIKFSIYKTQLTTRKIISLNLQLVKSNCQFVILFLTHKIDLQLVKLLCNS